jgi:hypothetical protein
MGYTHYYRGWVTLGDYFMDDVHRLIAAAGVKLTGAIGEDDPTLEEFDRIILNGLGEAGHEHFVLNHGVNHTGSFVKTERKEYDTLVAAILLRASNRSRGFKLSSDGAWDCDDWLEARQLYTAVFGELPIKPNEMRLARIAA